MADQSLADAQSTSNQTCRVQHACQAFLVAHTAVTALHEEGDRADPSALSIAFCRRHEALQQVRRQPAQTKRAIRAKLGVLRTLQAWLGTEDDVVGRFAIEMTEEMEPFFARSIAEDSIDEAARPEASDGRATWFHRLPPFLWFGIGPKQL